MSKLRRNNICNRNKVSSDEMRDLSKTGKMKLNKGKVIETSNNHDEYNF